MQHIEIVGPLPDHESMKLWWRCEVSSYFANSATIHLATMCVYIYYLELDLNVQITTSSWTVMHIWYIYIYLFIYLLTYLFLYLFNVSIYVNTRFFKLCPWRDCGLHLRAARRSTSRSWTCPQHPGRAGGFQGKIYRKLWFWPWIRGVSWKK